MRTNSRLRQRFQSRIEPDVRIEAVVSIAGARGPSTARRSLLVRYAERYGYTSTLGPLGRHSRQWLVLTENRLLLFAKHGAGLATRVGKVEHALDRTELELQWADFEESVFSKRLIHLTTNDQRMNIASTIHGRFDEAQLLVQAFRERGRQIGLQEL